MEACSPGDLDPHAVASVFKAYLRERKSANSDIPTIADDDYLSDTLNQNACLLIYMPAPIQSPSRS